MKKSKPSKPSQLNTSSLFRMPWTNSDNAFSWLEITRRCNLNCDYCYQKNRADRDKGLLQLEMVLKTLKGLLLADLWKDYSWPGNVRELEQAIRRVLITRKYSPVQENPSPQTSPGNINQIQEGTLDARNLLESYCTMLYENHGTYEKVARITGLDRRTVKKNIRLP
ncbi:MAG: hypothetical protein KKF30_12255 [Proteobacteria bacterium]|nr:hypothetical protein [Pseudomonadota bacterium]MBU4469452.1 hypothetical protein [Pseudomonadota bacterium]MCG2752353.1 hypothetical protein [Desulfobacteraceae bacterium]